MQICLVFCFIVSGFIYLLQVADQYRRKAVKIIVDCSAMFNIIINTVVHNLEISVLGTVVYFMY